MNLNRLMAASQRVTGVGVQRRDFCKLLAIASAWKGISAFAHATEVDQSALPGRFGEYIQDYAQFCALPPEMRAFYKVSGGDIVKEKLDEATWKSPAFYYNPTGSNVAGGMWDNVPVKSPIPNLEGQGPYKPTWDSLLQYEAPEWYQDAKFGIWAQWSPQCVPEAGDWYARNMYVEGRGNTNTTSNTTDRNRASDTKTSARSGHCSTGIPMNSLAAIRTQGRGYSFP
jgi:alpha-L-fucosidase